MGLGSSECETQLFVFPCTQELSVVVDAGPRPAVEHVEKKLEVVQDDR